LLLEVILLVKILHLALESYHELIDVPLALEGGHRPLLLVVRDYYVEGVGLQGRERGRATSATACYGFPAGYEFALGRKVEAIGLVRIKFGRLGYVGRAHT
jgi:hypothetical protein